MRKSSLLLVPFILVISILGGIALSTWIALEQEQQAYKEDAIEDFRVGASRLSRLAQLWIDSKPGVIEEEVMFTSLGLRNATVLIVDPDDKILFAHDSSWQHRPLAELININYIKVSHAILAMQHLGEITSELIIAYQHNFTVREQINGKNVRSEGRILIVKDISPELRALVLQDIKHQLPIAILLTIIAILLGIWLHRSIIKPVKQLAHASQFVGTQGQYDIPHYIYGELNDLKQAFIDMDNRLNRQQKELMDNLAFTHAVLAQAPDAIELADAETMQILDANEASCRLLGYTKEERLQQRVPDFQVGMSDSELTNIIEQILTVGFANFITKHKRKDGSLIDAQVGVRALELNDKKYLVAIWRDISDQEKLKRELEDHRHHLEEMVNKRTAELTRLTEELKESNNEQQALFDTATSGIVFVRKRTILRSNRAMESLFGYQPGEMINRTTRDWYTDEETFKDIGQSINTAFSAGEVFQRDQLLLRKDGSQFWAKMAAKAIDANDLSKGMVGIVTDITTEREAMHQIQEARVLAEDAARTKAEFLANMSHEIRTPMNAIIGMAHLLKSTDLNQQQRGYIAKLHQSSKHLLNIINDILDLSKIEAGKMSFENTPFQVEQVIKNVTDLIAGNATNKGLEVIIWIDSDVPQSLIGDALRLGQILINFATNAVKFTEQGEITLSTKLVNRSGSRATIRFEVTDTGIGISAEDAARLFEKFEQAESGTTRKYGGTGLGLTISKQLAEMMGGRVGVDGNPGEGSTFWMEIPLQIPDGNSAKALPPLDLRKRHILVIEQNAASRSAMTDTLSSMTFRAQGTGDSEVALEAIRTQQQAGDPFDLLFIDCSITDVENMNCATRIVKEFGDQAPPIILLTNQDNPDMVIRAAELGIQQIITKPASPSELFDNVALALNQTIDQPLLIDNPEQTTSDLSAIQGARILLVEDNEVNREVATELLEQAGLRVESAENGAIAIKMVTEQGPNYYDLVLMDMQMPVMDGLDATRGILANPANADLPIVAMTANVMAQDVDACLKAGMKDHICKPVEPESLWGALTRWIKAGPREPIISTAPAPVTPTRDLLSEFRNIRELDIDSALARVLDNQQRLVSVMSKFVTSQHDVDQNLLQTLENGDLTTAERIAHTLKSSSALIGATELSSLAQQVEKALHDKTSVTTILPMAHAIGAQLRPLLNAISTRLPEREIAKATDSPLDIEQLNRVCDQLAELLDDCDFAAEQALSQHEALLRQAFAKHYAPLENAVENYDYEKALEILLALRSQYAN